MINLFEELLQRSDTLKTINRINTNEAYYKKTGKGKYEVIGIFYDAIYKYSVLFDDVIYYDKYIEEVDYIFKKFSDIDGVIRGINKVLSRLIVELGNRDKKNFINYVVDKYIDHGYLLHAFNGVYLSEIKANGFKIDQYRNYYEDFKRAQEILDKYDCNYIDKDFNEKEIVFTDNMALAYYYSLRCPGYFYKYICGADFNNSGDAYTKKNYERCLMNVKKLIYTYNIEGEDKNFLLDLFDKEWKLLENDTHTVSNFMMIKRSFISDELFDIDGFIARYSKEEYEFILERLLNVDNNYRFSGDIDSNNIRFISIRNKEERNETKKVEFNEFDYTNSYGKVSFLLLIGSILITLGVIITLVFI